MRTSLSVWKPVQGFGAFSGNLTAGKIGVKEESFNPYDSPNGKLIWGK